MIGDGIRNIRAAASEAVDVAAKADAILDHVAEMIKQIKQNGLEITVFGVRLLVKVAQS